MSMFSFLSRKNMPPGSPGPASASSGENGAASLDDIVADLKKEWDRRLEALSMCLDEKSQENTQLHKLLKEREEVEKQLRNKIASLEVDLQTEKDVVREHQRRLEAMTRVLEDSIMHQSAGVGQLPQFSDIENEKFLTPDEVAARKASTSSETVSAMDSLPGNNYSVSKSQRGGKGSSATSPTKKSNADPEPDSSESDKKSKKTTEDKKSSETQEAKPIKRAEKVGAKKDSTSNTTASKDDESEKEEDDPLKITPAEERDPLKALSDAKVTIFKLKKENTVYQQKNEALAESICKYESKLVKADKYFRENLLKESRRRKDAEYVAAVLKKRVTQLQFLLDEANNSQSDSDKTPRSGEISSVSKDEKGDSEQDDDDDEEDNKKKKPVKRATAKKRSKKDKDDSDSDSDDD